MVEKERKPLKRYAIGEDIPVVEMVKGFPKPLSFLLEDLGKGTVEFKDFETEGGSYPIGDLQTDRLNLVSFQNGQAIVNQIPTHIDEFTVFLEMRAKVPKNLRCIVTIGDLQLEAVNEYHVLSEEDEKSAYFVFWGNQNVEPDYLLVHYEPELLNQMKIRFEQKAK